MSMICLDGQYSLVYIGEIVFSCLVLVVSTILIQVLYPILLEVFKIILLHNNTSSLVYKLILMLVYMILLIYLFTFFNCVQHAFVPASREKCYKQIQAAIAKYREIKENINEGLKFYVTLQVRNLLIACSRM